MSQMGIDLVSIAPQLAVLVTAVVVLSLEMMRRPQWGIRVLIIGMTIAAGTAISMLGTHTTAFSETFRVDRLSLWAVIILSAATILCALLASAEIKGTPREGAVYALMVFGALGAMILAGSGDFMFIVLGLLIGTLSGMAMAAHPRENSSSEGAMKYFVYGSVTGAIMLFGITFWVGLTGTTLLSGLNDPNLPALVTLIGFISLVAGIGYAASLFPIHFWTPDTFEGAPVSVAAYLSVVPKIGALFALVQVLRELPVAVVDWPIILAVFAAMSMTYGNVVALWQDNVVRLLSYSTIAQSGYYLLGIIGISQSSLVLDSLIVFGAAYMLMNIGAFAITQAEGTRLENFKNISKWRPWPAVGMTVFLLSLVGMPPLAGFAGKFLLFGTAIEAGFTWLAVVAILNSTISLAVYMRIIVPMFFHESKMKSTESYAPAISVVWISTFILTIVVGIGVQWLLN
ncbi:NADH-quinone oxidoreductase subunit N [Gracilimonas tropica]|uniref:NADH-quinone oxidoreductase subunit N n=1 Tax=Gracilimonas tropica TaxID=454600 RepID=UPI00036ADC0D|nr:NADH-quinone oxidoreductase subunit N [Gracilimonas tropica]